MFDRTTPDTPSENAPRLARLGDLLGEWEADARAANEARVTQTPRGAVTGLGALDRELGGALVPGTHILHAGPGVGKTAFALQAAASCGCPALYVTCEMSRLELFRRHVARVTSTYLGRLKSGELLPADSLTLAKRGAAAAPRLTIADATTAPASPMWIRAAAEATRDTAEHFLLVVDSVHSWADAIAEGAPEYEALNAGLAALRQLASGLGCAVLTIAERNRASMTSGGLSAGAGTRKIEYGAETVLELSRKEDAIADAGGEVDIALKIAKNRNGSPGGKLSLKFQGALQRFREA
jgi:replicative DNA helicase